MIPAIVGIPIKPFSVAKGRLSGMLDAKQRSALGRAVAARTASIVAESGPLPVVVTDDDGVAGWAKGMDLGVLPEGLTGARGLNAAAAAVAHVAAGEPWAVVHADLPIAVAGDFAAVWSLLDHEPAVLAPSHDGGTNVLAAHEPINFAYGPGSCTTHLRTFGGAAVVARIGLAHDLDTPHDLVYMRTLSRGRWLRSLLEVIEASPAT